MRGCRKNSFSVRPFALAACVVALSFWGCASDKLPRADSAVAQLDAVPVPPATAASAGTSADTSCHKEGLWASCSVHDRLVRAGIVVHTKDEPARYPFLTVSGTTYGVGAGDDEVQVFLYTSEDARRADTDKLDSAAVSPKGARRTYKVPPMLVTSNNLTALVFTLNERTRERIALALSAGLPQPRH